MRCRTPNRTCPWFLLLLVIGTGRADSADISFHNDVMAVISKAGCNLGTCHGNARGKGGFQISLRGQDPDLDYGVLTRELFGRRVNPSDPDQSLLLLKPTMQMAHEGGQRFRRESLEYRILREWIATGMPADPKGYPQLDRLTVTPDEIFLRGNPDPSQGGAASAWRFQIRAVATFTDGSSRDVTSLAVYEMAQPIADVTREGYVTGRVSGETTILVRYLNQQLPVRVSFVVDKPQFAWSAPPAANFVDELVFSKLKKLQINPSELCDDATFIRRVSLDLLGLLPAADEAKRFIADASPDKRRALIDTLLERPEFSEWWAMKWADLLRIEEKTLDQKGVENFHAWLRDSIATHKPLDQMVRQIVSGRGSTYEVPPANFYRALRNPFERSETVGQLFLGVRLQCSKCHNHPFDRWTQNDYYGWGSVFARVEYKIIENRRRDNNDSHEFDGEQIVFLSDSGTAKDPRTDKPQPAKFLGSADILDSQVDPLNELANWLTDQHHERFTQVLANRTWQQIMGRGIVDPIDDFRATNPPSNPALLKALSDELAFGPGAHISTDRTRRDGAFDLRSFLRTILNSRTYQLSSVPNETNKDDDVNFSKAIVRRHSAEQLLDTISQVLNLPMEFTGFPKGSRAAQLPGVGAIRSRDHLPSEADRFLRLFGKPPRLQSCDCERSDESTLGQTFQLVSGSLINSQLATRGNRLDGLLASNQPPEELVTQLYWITLTRPPAPDELQATVRHLEKSPDKRTALEDIAWGLFNSNEFLLRR